MLAILAILAMLAMRSAARQRRALGVGSPIVNGEERREALAEGIDGLGTGSGSEGDR